MELRSLFSSANQEHETRHAHRLVTARAETNAGERRICNVREKKFNKLPSEVWGAPTMNSFRRVLIRALRDM